MIKIFDTHAHYTDSKYDEDREKIFREMYIEGVDKICLIGPNKLESIGEKELMNQYNAYPDMPKFYHTVGDHPDEVLDDIPDSNKGLTHIDEMEAICKNDDGKVSAVAIGEIGLDYYGDTKKEDTFHKQKEWFIAYMELAKKMHLPIVVHSRDACKDTFDLIMNHGKNLSGIIHCFSYEKETAIQYINMGYHIGIGGVLTFKNARKLKEVVEAIPLESIVTETDCPWMAPTPHRGERNQSSYIKYVIEEIANIKKMDVERVSEVLYQNALVTYNLL